MRSKPTIFVILTLVVFGVYLATTIPVAVFPEVNFPRVLVGIDNGVAPIDQMQVTVTRPVEEALNSVEGLERVQSITSRGTVEVDLFFSWKVDMFQTLQRVNAALARVQSELPPTAKVTANRLTFAAFPIMGYSLTSDTVPMTRLWELATYDLKPRLNRKIGVSTIVVQGGQEPEFEVRPDPAKLVQTQITVPNLLEAIGRSNMIDSPGLFENNHQLVLSLVSGQARSLDDISDIVVKTTALGAPIKVGDIAAVSKSIKPVYVGVTANAKTAVLMNVFRQPDSNTVTVAQQIHAEIDTIRKELPKGVELQPFYDQSDLVNDSIASVRDAVVIGIVLASLIMVLFLRDWGTSLVAGMVIPATLAITFIVLRLLGRELQPDDARRPRRRGRPGHRRCDRRGREHRAAPRRRTGSRRGDPQRDRGDSRAADRIDDHADRRLPAAGGDHRRDRRVLPRAGDHGRHGAADVARPGAHVDADAQPLFSGPAPRRDERQREPERNDEPRTSNDERPPRRSQRPAVADAALRAHAAPGDRPAGGARDPAASS